MPQVYGKVKRSLPALTAEDAQLQARSGSYGEQMVVPVTTGLYSLADEGSYYKAINPTPGTGIAQTIQTAFSSTNAVLTIRNASASNKRIYLDYIRLINTVVGTSTTRSEGLISIDNITRYTSGGSAITALPNANMDSANVSTAVVHFGALGLLAESGSVRRISRIQLRAAIMVAFEEWVITFGSQESSAGTIGGATALRSGVSVGPVVLGDGDTMSFHLWNPSNAVTAPSWEFELGWWER